MKTESFEGAQIEGGLYATFLLAGAVFGVSAQQVQEVVRPGAITPVHHAPPFVLGIRNLRGKIVTVIDLAVRLDLGSAEVGPDTRVLIVDWQGEPVGLLVDSVSDTITIDAGHLEAPPANVHGVQSRHLRGIHRGPERLVAVMDLGAVLQPEEGPGSAEGPHASVS
jgi:purine-binding chemotaxis protein CheW